MTVRVERDGMIVDLNHGTQLVNGREVPVSTSKVCSIGNEFPDDAVAPYVLERARAAEGKAGEAFSYRSDDAEKPVELGPGVEPSDLYDPDKHNQGAVLQYLKDADDAEVERVKEAEASGQNRQGIASFTKSAAGE